MKAFKYILLTFAILFFASGCEREIKFKGEETDPMLVLNALINADEQIRINLSQSCFFLIYENKGFKQIKDADIELYVNNEFKEKLSFKTIIFGEEVDYPYWGGYDDTEYGHYVSNYIAKAGDQIRIVANKEGFVEAVSELVVPEIIPFQSTEIYDLKEEVRPYASYNYVFDEEQDTYVPVLDTLSYIVYDVFKLKVKFKDEENFKNFYRIKLTQWSILGDGYEQSNKVEFKQSAQIENNDFYREASYFSSNNPVFIQNNNSMEEIFGDDLFSNTNPFLMFSDEFFDGETYELIFDVILYKYSVSKEGYESGMDYKYELFSHNELEINFYQITRDYYLYLRTIDAYENNLGIFAEPVQIYSNVKGGIGIIGGQSYFQVRERVE